MSYRMHVTTYDNSAVDTRQVRRQRERLASKGRREPPFNGEVRSLVWSTSKYMPHNGKREMERRRSRLAA